MPIAYIDESGDVGPRHNGGSRTYVLGVVLVPGLLWADVFDRAISFRRHLRDTIGLPMRAEVKANWLVRGSGDLRKLKLNDHERRGIYEQHMRFLSWNKLTTWAVVIDKPAEGQPRQGVSEVAWETMFQRLERHVTHDHVGPVIINHDEGDDLRIRKQARQRRRYGTSGSLRGGTVRNDFRELIDDPVPRNSSESYFVQMADLAAYAAYRACFPPPARRVNVVDARTWSKAGDARNLAVAKRRPRHPDTSIVLRSMP